MDFLDREGSREINGLEKIMDPDLVCSEWLVPDPVNIRPDPKPCLIAERLNMVKNLIPCRCEKSFPIGAWK